MLRQPTEFVAPEFTTWRDEQRAWREGIAFYDQSFHMTTTYLRGAEAQRPWLPATSEEATWALGGSFNAPKIEDYYFTSRELGYGNLIKFDHDFVGREALERTAGDDHRRKVTLVWDPADVARVVESYMRPEELPALYMEFPRATYATWQYDAVDNDQGRTIGASTYTGVSWNERAMLSLAVVEPEYAKPGTRVSVTWGEPDGGAKSPWLEPHRQMEIGATVAPAPLGK